MKHKNGKNSMVITKDIFMQQLVEMLTQCLYYYNAMPTYNNWVSSNHKNRDFLSESDFNMLRLLAASKFSKNISDFYNKIMKNKIHQEHLIEI